MTVLTGLFRRCTGTTSILQADRQGEEPVDPERIPYMDDMIRATAWLAGYLASREQ